jgi:hypothetical protein
VCLDGMVRAALHPQSEQDMTAARAAWTRLVKLGRRVRARVPSRLARRRPHPPVARWQPPEAPPDAQRADYHAALGDTHRRFGEREAAVVPLRSAIKDFVS